MLIRSQDHNTIVNLDQATTIYIKENKTTKLFEVRVYTKNSYVTDVLGQYLTEKEAQEVLTDIENLDIQAPSSVFYMPNNE